MSTTTTVLHPALLKLTAEECEEALAEAGVRGPAAQLLVREGAPYRRAMRRKAAAEAAKTYYTEKAGISSEDISDDLLRVHVAVIAALDLAAGEEDASTARHPAFWGLAGDERIGPWNDTLRELLSSIGSGGTFSPENGGLAFITEREKCRISLGMEHGPAGWRLRIAREGIRRSAGLPHRMPTIVMKANPEDMKAWGEIFNWLMDEIQKEE